jgi:hypothetical protein
MMGLVMKTLNIIPGCEREHLYFHRPILLKAPVLSDRLLAPLNWPRIDVEKLSYFLKTNMRDWVGISQKIYICRCFAFLYKHPFEWKQHFKGRRINPSRMTLKCNSQIVKSLSRLFAYSQHRRENFEVHSLFYYSETSLLTLKWPEATLVDFWENDQRRPKSTWVPHPNTPPAALSIATSFTVW